MLDKHVATLECRKGWRVNARVTGEEKWLSRTGTLCRGAGRGWAEKYVATPKFCHQPLDHLFHRQKPAPAPPKRFRQPLSLLTSANLECAA